MTSRQSEDAARWDSPSRRAESAARFEPSKPINPEEHPMTQAEITKYTSGNFRVVRNCCRSGLCIRCMGKEQRPTKIIQAYGYSKPYAEYVAKGWKDYAAKIEQEQ